MHATSIINREAVNAPSPAQPKLVHAAHEFEAQMMKELMKPMTRSSDMGGAEGDDEDAGSSGALGEFASEAMAQALSERGGFGVADRILRELSPRSDSTPVRDQESEKGNARIRVGK
jgi:Rod binding domain-containing protein